MSDEKTPQIRSEMLENPVFRRVLADALAIQDRFLAEPVYAKTGKGYLKSAGVEELQQIKQARMPTLHAAVGAVGEDSPQASSRHVPSLRFRQIRVIFLN